MKNEVLSIRQIQKVDSLAIERYGIPSLVLMENAGCALAQEVLHILGKKKRARVSIVCGVGNNAGDGFVAARHLINKNVMVEIFLVGSVSLLKHDALVNYQILKKIKHPIKKVDNSFKKNLAKADIVVDAIFGFGLNRDIEEPFKSVIETINKEAKYIVAVDIPSGLNGDTGKMYGCCVRANTTVTFTRAKTGFYLKNGPKNVGKIVVVDIGIPSVIIS